MSNIPDNIKKMWEAAANQKPAPGFHPGKKFIKPEKELKPSGSPLHDKPPTEYNADQPIPGKFYPGGFKPWQKGKGKIDPRSEH